MAYEQVNISNMMFRIGVNLLVLYNPFVKNEISNSKALIYAFEFFKESACLGGFYAKILAACLAKELNQSFSELTKTDLEKVTRLSNTLEDKRSLALCYYYKFLKESVESEYVDVSHNEDGAIIEQLMQPEHLYNFEKAAFPDVRDDRMGVFEGDLLALYYITKIRLEEEDAGYWYNFNHDILMSYQSKAKKDFNSLYLLQKKISELTQKRDSYVSRAPKILNEIRDLKNSAFELMLCSSSVPTEVVLILEKYLQNNNFPLISTSINNFLWSAHQASYIPPSPAYKFPCRIL